MTKYVLIFFLATNILFSQNVKVISNEPVTSSEEGVFFFPKISPDGTSIIFTNEAYHGLWLYNSGTEKISKLNDHRGSGYDPNFSIDGSEVIFRKDEFINRKKYSSIIVQDITTKSERFIEENKRDLIPVKVLPSNQIVYLKEKEIIKAPVNEQLNKNQNLNEPFVFVENSKLVLSKDGNYTVLDPLGDGHYLWPSISPDGTKILFTLAGKGTYIIDLEGNLLLNIGYAHYPGWSNDGKWIVFMEDYDDGYQVTNSDIFVISAEGGDRINLTDGNDKLEMYPKWSPVSNEIVYHTADGIIYKMKLQID